MKKTLLVAALIFAFSFSYAKIWRINNNAGITADFTTVTAAINSTLVQSGDTLHIEASAATYPVSGNVIPKSLTYIGVGYFLDPANSTEPANTGLQVSTQNSILQFLRLGSEASGSKFIGITFSGAIYLNGTSNIAIERCYFYSNLHFENGINNNVSLRKSFFINSNQVSTAVASTVTNFVCENNIFFNSSFVNMPQLSGSGNIFRNNTVSGFNGMTLVNTYVANNIFGITPQCNFTNCTIKNNLFQIAQTLPGTATNNQVSVNMNNVVVGGTTGSLDSRMQLKPGSPAIAAGLTVGTVITPDCGAFGATDPYKLSGIPNIPTIYTMNVPASIPSGSATMNVTFSTRNNN
ncbi:MAG: right-handed parallel beta-helix repeat-containing protein [Sphingobacteriales bacterium]|nr:MAG: right-handed parallel beta-helix repeat-containing protein [Sphingobacteriales bacterium]